MTNSAHLHELQISQRPPTSWKQTWLALLFSIIFETGCFMIFGFQLSVLLPLKLLPWRQAQLWYDEGIRYSKGAFGTLIVLVTQVFAPTSLVISFQREGPGGFTQEEIDALVVRDKSGNVVELRLPQKTVLIANHQIYADWWFAWVLTYLTGTYKDVYIVLKKSLKWVPVIGWGMQFYNFIFLARSWASDRLYLSNQLSWLGQRAQTRNTPLTFILYPEGTLVSKNTRPLSKKYADKIGVADMSHTLLPRSTGLHYSLRSLAPRIPNLQMIDITMAYPGIPPFGYGQSYYTLRSIFLDGVPPPKVHMHIRRFDVAKDVPIGDLSSTNPKVKPTLRGDQAAIEVDIPQIEKDSFDLWLRDLWCEKDKDISRYLERGYFVDSPDQRIEVPIALRQKREVLDAFCFFIPALIGWGFSKLR